MAERTSEYRPKPSAPTTTPNAAASGPHQAKLAQLASTLNAAPVVQRLASLVPLRAASGPAVAQAFYYEKYGGLSHGSGTDAHVGIEGKNDPGLAQGSKPSVNPSWWPTSGKAADYFSNYAVQGHLLNDNLGGTGKAMKNLTPITRSTNSTHFHQVEAAVKKAVLVDNKPVEYHVYADYSTHPKMSELGNSPPPEVEPYLAYMAGTIGADYTVYHPKTSAVTGGLPGDLLVKNEGPDLKGTFK